MKFNPAVTSSRRKVRKAYFTADSATRAKMMSSRLSKELREKYNVKTMPIRKNDVVEIVRGGHKLKGKVLEVRRADYRIIVEGANQKPKNEDAKPVPYPVHPSNCVITELYLNGSRHRMIARKAPKKA